MCCCLDTVADTVAVCSTDTNVQSSSPDCESVLIRLGFGGNASSSSIMTSDDASTAMGSVYAF